MMRTNANNFGFRKSVIALAVVVAYGPAFAGVVDDTAQFTNPNASQVSVGIGMASGDESDRSIWGQYNGKRDHDVNLLLDFDYLTRDNATGTWTRAEGRDLGLDTRELRFSQERQGDWKYGIEYSGNVKHDIRTINTSMTGAGSTTPTLNYLAVPGEGRDVNLEIKRTNVGVSLGKWFGPALQVEASYRHEDKEGARIFGKGFTCTSGAAPGCNGSTAGVDVGFGVVMTPEPIDSTTHQLEAKLNYLGDNFAVTAGYYGSIYNNGLSTLTPNVPGTMNNAIGAPLPVDVTGSTSLRAILNMPLALAPDNEAHQFYVSGNYSFTPTTKATFKYAYTHATQDDAFPSSFSPPAGVKDLSGEVNTQLAQFGLTARPIKDLSLLANVRYEKKEDKTPVELYNIEGTSTFTNDPASSKRLVGKLEGSYMLPSNYRLTLGVDHESMERELPIDSTDVAGLSALRKKTDETGWRLEVQKVLSETLTGSLSYLSSKRDGSDWMTLSTLNPANPAVTPAQLALINAYCGGMACYGQNLPAAYILALSNSTGNAAGVTNSTAILPSMLMDRQRDKWRLMADWNPTDRVSLQFLLENGHDNNDVNGAVRGLQDTDMKFYSVDAMYALSDAWKLTAYVSHGDQSMFVNHSTGYAMELNNKNTTLGIGVRGKATDKLSVGADLSFTNDVTKYVQDSDPTLLSGGATGTVATLATLGQLPDVKFSQTALKLYGNYALDKQSNVRVDLVHQLAKLKEWTWESNGTPFVYADNTTVTIDPKQTVNYLGVSYIHKFQ
jgi:MtrB/PioB family decaheme-associated outer membrane protein